MFAFRPRRTLHSMLYYYYYKIAPLSGDGPWLADRRRVTRADGPSSGRNVSSARRRSVSGNWIFRRRRWLPLRLSGLRCTLLLFRKTNYYYYELTGRLRVTVTVTVAATAAAGRVFRALLSCLAGSHTINECRKWRRRSDPSRVKSYRSHTAQYAIRTRYIHLYVTPIQVSWVGGIYIYYILCICVGTWKRTSCCCHSCRDVYCALNIWVINGLQRMHIIPRYILSSCHYSSTAKAKITYIMGIIIITVIGCYNNVCISRIAASSRYVFGIGKSAMHVCHLIGALQ